jgi:RHS repeat-associated protein
MKTRPRKMPTRVLPAASSPLRRIIAQFLALLLFVQSMAVPGMASPRLPDPLASFGGRALSVLGTVFGERGSGEAGRARAAVMRSAALTPVEEFGVVLTPLSTAFNAHGGLDYHQPSRKVVASANAPAGQPHNFELIEGDGTHRSFSNLSGLPDEIRIATARDAGQGLSLGGFAPGESFIGTGAAGVVARVAPDGAKVQNPWVTLPGETGHPRGGLHVDRTGVFGGDLLAATTSGRVWRVSAAGVVRRLAELGTPLGGVVSVPNDVVRYGPWAGKALVGAPEQGLIYAVDAEGNVASFQTGLQPSDLEIIPAHENFYGLDPAAGRIWGAPAAAFTSMIGDILVAQKSPGVLAHVRWSGTKLEVGEIARAAEWGDATFAPAGIAEIAGVRQLYDRIAVVRHAPALDSGRVEGALWQLSAESVTLDGTDTITSDLLVPGTPNVVVGAGRPTFGGVIEGPESAVPTGYSFNISGSASLRHLITRTNPIELDEVAAPPAPTGARDVTLDRAGQTVGDFATLRHLTLTGKAGAVPVPPGTYGRFAASGHNAFVLGTQGSDVPTAYDLEELSLTGGSELRLAGPVILTVRNNVTLVGTTLGAPEEPRRLQLRVAAGAVRVSGNGVLYGVVRVPRGNVTVEGNGRLRGTVSCDTLTVSGNGVLQITESDITPPPINRPPAVNAGPDQTLTLPSDTVGLSGVASDDGLPEGSSLSLLWSKVSGPGPVTFGSPAAAATSATFTEPGTYVLRLRASDGLLTSSDEVSVEVIPRNQPPKVDAGSDQTVELPGGASLSGVVTDDALPRGSTVTTLWQMLEGPGQVVFADAGSTTTAATFSAPGTYTLRLSANDTEFIASDTLVVEVFPENQPPTVNAGADQTIRLPAAAALQGTAADDGWPHGSSLTTTWSQVGGPGTVTFADASAPVTSASFSEPGAYTLRLTASDTRFNVGDEVSIIVLPANLAPSADAGPDQAVALGANLLRNGGNESEPVENEIPNWTEAVGNSWTQAGAALPASAEGATYFYAGDAETAELRQDVDVSAFAADTAAGLQQFEFRARVRSAAEAAPDTARVVVEYRDASNENVLAAYDSGEVSSPGNWAALQDVRTAPAATRWVRVRLLSTRHTGATNDGYFDALSLRAKTGAGVRLSGAVTDDGLPAGATLSAKWSFESGPGTVKFADPNRAETTATFEQPGTYVLKLTADDSELSASDEVSVTVSVANQPPAVDAGADQSLKLADTANLAGVIADDGLPAGATANVLWSKLSGPGEVTFGDPSNATTTASFTQPGEYVLKLSAGDSEYVVHDELTLVVRPNNLAPVVNAGADQTVTLPTDTVNLSGTVTDDGSPEGGALTTAWSKISGPGEVTFGDAASASTTAAFAAAGTYVLRLTADDSELTSSDDLLVVVNPQNFPPTVGAGPDQTIVLTNPAVLSGTYSDDGLPEGSTLGVTWSKVSGPGAVTFEDPGAEATTATFGEEGTYVLRLTVSDSEHTVFDELTVTVIPFNQPPTVNAGLDQTVVPPANSVRLNGSAADDGLPVGGQLTVTWSKVSGPGNVIFGEPHSAITAATFAQTGTYVLRLTANDSQYEASDDVTVTADCPGSLQHLDVVLVLDRSGSMSGQALADAKTAAKTFVDFMLLAEGDQVGLVSFESTARLDSPLTSDAAAVKAAIDALVSSGGTNIANGITAAHQELISARHNPASTPVMIVLSDGGATAPTTAANAAKAAGIRLITVGIGSANESVLRPIASSDSDYHQAPTSADLANVYASIAGAVCRTVNHPPSLSAGPDQEIELPTNTLTLNGSASDDGLPDGANFTTKWTKVSGTGTVTFGNANSLTTSVTITGAPANAVNTYVLRLTVSDSQFTLTDDVTVTLQPDNFPPTVSAGADKAITMPDNTVTLDGSVTDDGRPVGVPLSVSWAKVTGPGTVTFGSPGQAVTTATFGATGSYTLRLTANDGKVTRTDSVVVTVNPDNFAPTANAGANQTITLPNTVNLAGTVTDDGKPAGSALVVMWGKVSGPGDVTFSPPNAPFTVAGFTAAGTYVLRLTASDTQLTDTDDVTVTVNPQPATNQAPSASAGPDRTVTLPANTVTLNGIVSDDGLPAGATLTSTWTRVSGPGTVTFGSPNSSVTTATFTVAGTYSLRLTASDSLLTKTDTVTVVVNPSNVAPVANAGANQTITLPDNTLTLNGTVTDDGKPPGANVTISWSRVSGPAAVTFGSPNSAVTTATFTVAGTYTLRLTANDSLLSDTDDVTVTVKPANKAPVISAGPDQTIVYGANLLKNPGAEEPPVNGKIPFWTEVSGTWTRAVAGGSPVSLEGVTYFDPEGETAELRQDVDVSAFAANIAAGLQQFALKVHCQSAEETPADLCRVILEYRNAANTAVLASLDSGTLTSVSEWGELTDSRPAPAGTGRIRVRLIAARAGGASNDAFFDGLSLSPVLSAGAKLSGTATDDGLPEGSSLSGNWSKASGPGTVRFAAPNAPVTTATFSEAGTYVLRLSVSDTQITSVDEVTVTVNSVSAPNQPPQVDAGLDLAVTLPAEATLNGSAYDDGKPEGNALAYEWTVVSGPGALTFNDPHAAVTNVAFSTAGTYVLRLSVTDGEFTSGDDVVVVVDPAVTANQPPAVNAGADQTSTLPNDTVTLSGTATDDGLPEGSTLSINWAKVSGPAAVTFGTPNQPVTTATFAAAGTYVLRLTANDSAYTRGDDVTVIVSPANKPPVVSAGTDQNINLPNAAALKGSATDDGRPAGSTLTVTWSVVAGAGAVAFANQHAAQTTATFDTPGEYILRLTADDTEQTASDEIRVVVYEPVTGPPPTLKVTSPADGSVVTARTDVFGTVSGGSWKLEYSLNTDGGSSAQVWTGVASGSGPVTNGKLGTIDPTLLLNGNYSFRLTASDASGQTTVINTGVTVSGEQKVGNFSLSFNDLELPVAGLPIQVVRSYDSREKRTGDFGTGWTLGVKNVRLEKDGPVGKGWEQTVAGGFLPRYCLQPTRAHVITVTFPDGKVYRFQAATSPQCLQIYPISNATVVFKPLPGDAGTQGATLVSLGGAEVLVQGGVPGATELYSYSDLRSYDPTLFKLTTADGSSYVIDQRLGVRSMTDANGNTLTVNGSGIVHSAGKSVTFTRDAQGRITKITDPAGASMSYAYDAAGDLVGFTDRENNTTTFAYNSTHGLLTIKDPTGLQPVRNEYDDAGRLVSTTDASGKTVTYTHDLDNRRETVTDRLGQITVHEYDARGNVTKTVYPDGKITLASYDARGNVLTQTDQLGRTVTYAYDAQDNKTSETDALGNVRRYTYNARRKVLTTTDARGNVTANAYDANGNLTSTRDPLGNVTSYTYTTGGLLASVVDARGNTRRLSYNPSGELTREVDEAGTVKTYSYGVDGRRLTETAQRVVGGVTETLQTKYEYDRLGRIVGTTYPGGSVMRTAYDSRGRQSALVDSLGRRTAYEYDGLGQLKRTTYPGGGAEETFYDAEGRRTKTVDRSGRATTYVYDALGRLEKTVLPDGKSVSTTYDAAGRPLSRTDELGRVTRYEYDAAGRLIKLTDALGNVVTYGYDANGNRNSATDPKGQTTRYEYDAANRLTRVTYPDGTFASTTFDSEGRVLDRTDQAGTTTRFEYGKRGELLKVTDAAGGVTTYTYDEQGRQLTQTDANGHTTRFEYDREGRRTKRTLPLGMSETYAYDTAGRVTSRTDFNGKSTAYGYDALGRLASRTPDPSLGQAAVTYTYTPSGRRATMTDATGTTTYTYDERDRLTSKATPHGTLSYTYDAAGNLLTTRSSNAEGVSVDYTYDALNRIATVTDNRAGADATAYAYDANGNLESATYPNQVRSAYTYNSINRLTNLSVTGGATLASYAYTLGAAGQRQSVTEASGRVVNYTYDALYRLTSEAVAGDAGGVNGLVSYAFDAVGNRLSRTSTLPAVTNQTLAYDANDRLTSDLYDANGNTKQSQGVEYTYDWENRLSSANGGSVTYAYDGDGNRVAKTAGGVTTRYLVDTNNPTGYAQVVEELQGGAVVRQYTYGHDLISQRQLVAGQWSLSYYGYDGHGSVRLLTDSAGAVTDTYTYDAFGTLTARTGATPNEYLYAGERFDPETGLYHLRARYMRPETGRFWSMDSFEGAAADPPSLHKYMYAGADPVNNVDPSGHFFISLGQTMYTLAIASVIGAITGGILGGITGGWRGALQGALHGAWVAPLITAAVLSGAIWVAPAIGVSGGAFILAANGALSVIFATIGIYNYTQAQTTREKVAAVVSVIMAVAGGYLGYKGLSAGNHRTPAQVYADAVQGQGLSRSQRPATVGVLETKAGVEVPGGSGSQPTRPDMQALLESIPQEARSPKHHGNCAEVNCVGNALDQGLDPTGGRISTAKVRNPGHPDHGQPHDPCETCTWILRYFDITYYE